MDKTTTQCWTLWSIALFLLPVSLAEAQGERAARENIVLRRFAVPAKQGVAVDQQHFYAISNTRIIKCDKQTGEEIATWQADRNQKEHEHFLHLNSGTVIEGKLYCAHSRYSLDPNDNTVEIWNVAGKTLTHEKTITMPREHGSLVWIDRRGDGSWWMCYAVYGAGKNQETKLVKYEYREKNSGEEFVEIESWMFPGEVVANWGTMSCSGGSWGPDGFLYTTGHDHPRTYVLDFDKKNRLRYVRTEENVGFDGQAIAWDRYSSRPVLWGIVKNRNVSLTLIPAKRDARRNNPEGAP